MSVSQKTPLAAFLTEQLEASGMGQTAWCQRNGFEQSLFSKLLNSVKLSISLESALKLAVGFRIEPGVIFGLIGRPDLDQLVMTAYRIGGSDDYQGNGKRNHHEILAAGLETQQEGL